MMKKEGLLKRSKNTFIEGSGFKLFLLSVLFTGLYYGIYKGMLDNYLVEMVGMGEMDRGITEFFREVPGIMLIFILAAFYMLSAEALYKAGAVIMLTGMGMLAILPPGKVLVILALLTFSFGEHIQLGMKNTLSLKYAKPGYGGSALGVQNAATQIGTLAGYLVIVIAFSFLTKNHPYKLFFLIAAGIALVSVAFSLGITGKSETDATKRRFFFHRKYRKYYMLEMFYGARKQVFFYLWTVCVDFVLRGGRCDD